MNILKIFVVSSLVCAGSAAKATDDIGDVFQLTSAAYAAESFAHYCDVSPENQVQYDKAREMAGAYFLSQSDAGALPYLAIEGHETFKRIAAQADEEVVCAPYRKEGSANSWLAKVTTQVMWLNQYQKHGRGAAPNLSPSPKVLPLPGQGR